MLINETMTLGEKFVNSLGITILGMVVVFSVLIIIASSLKLLSILFGDNYKKKIVNDVEKLEKETVNITQSNLGIEEDIDLVLLLTAAVAVHSNKSADDIIVSSIKPIGQKSSKWASVGRQEQMLRNI